jgi:hypothetical protein
VRDTQDAEFLTNGSPDIPVLGTLPHALGVQDADRNGIPVYDHVETLRHAAEQIAQSLTKNIEESRS